MHSTLNEQLLQICATLLFSILQLLKLYQDSKCNNIRRRPLYRVPVKVEKNGLPKERFLCYNVRGWTNQAFNLISDTCVSVNALYSLRGNSSVAIISKIGILAKDNDGRCQQIGVDLIEECAVSVNGQQVVSEYTSDGVDIHVHRHNNSRVRISVPNCNGSDVLVMWVRCPAKRWKLMMPFDISKETSLGRTSHGLVGECSTSYSIGQSVHAIMRRH